VHSTQPDHFEGIIRFIPASIAAPTKVMWSTRLLSHQPTTEGLHKKGMRRIVELDSLYCFRNLKTRQLNRPVAIANLASLRPGGQANMRTRAGPRETRTMSLKLYVISFGSGSFLRGCTPLFARWGSNCVIQMSRLNVALLEKPPAWHPKRQTRRGTTADGSWTRKVASQARCPCMYACMEARTMCSSRLRDGHSVVL